MALPFLQVLVLLGCLPHLQAHVYCIPSVRVTLQAMANDFDLNMGNNIRMRDTQFISMFWLKTLENQVKCILPCILLKHTGGINLYFDMKHGLKHRKGGYNVFVRCFGVND